MSIETARGINCDISGVRIAQIPEAWEAVAPLLARSVGVSCAEEGLADIYLKLQEGTYQLWVVSTEEDGILAVAVTVVYLSPKGSVVEAVHLGGERLANWLDDLVSTVEEWSRELGACETRIKGRRGWEKVFGRLGYSPSAVIMSKPIRLETEVN